MADKLLSMRKPRRLSHLRRKSSLSTHLSVSVRVENLTYSVPRNQKGWKSLLFSSAILPLRCIEDRMTILENINFKVKSGQLLAILGSSGSGKTSLLDVLLCRHATGQVTGKVLLNGQERTPEMVEAFASYVRQEDNLMPSLTVRETLTFVAQLKLPRMFTLDEIKERDICLLSGAKVTDVIQELALTEVADTRVGDAEMRGISGGERRRVSIGIQLLINPSVLVLDEPTSGLDSKTAGHIVSILARLADNRRTVIMTIHQPRASIFDNFNLIMLLSRGHLMYFGKADEMVSYFSRLGYPCPALTNPCDYYVDLTSIDHTIEDTKDDSRIVVEFLQDAYIHHYKTLHPLTTNDLKDTISNVSSFYDNFVAVDVYPGRCLQFFVLFRRLMRSGIENYNLLVVHSCQALALSFLLGVLYYRLEKTQETIRDHFAVLFMICLTYSYTITLDTIQKCHDDRKLVYFETQDHLYTLEAYYMAKIASDLLFHTVYTVFYVLPVYFLVCMPLDLATFSQVFIIIYLNVLCCRALAITSSMVMPTFQMSSYFAQAIFSLCFMSAGFFINLDNIVVLLRWLSVISYIRWSFQSLCILVIKPLTFSCQGAIHNECVRDGSAALKMYSLDQDTLWQALVTFVCTFGVFVVLMFLALKFIPQIPEEH